MAARRARRRERDPRCNLEPAPPSQLIMCHGEADERQRHSSGGNYVMHTCEFEHRLQPWEPRRVFDVARCSPVSRQFLARVRRDAARATSTETNRPVSRVAQRLVLGLKLVLLPCARLTGGLNLEGSLCGSCFRWPQNISRIIRNLVFKSHRRRSASRCVHVPIKGGVWVKVGRFVSTTWQLLLVFTFHSADSNIFLHVGLTQSHDEGHMDIWGKCIFLFYCWTLLMNRRWRCLQDDWQTSKPDLSEDAGRPRHTVRLWFCCCTRSIKPEISNNPSHNLSTEQQRTDATTQAEKTIKEQ